MRENLENLKEELKNSVNIVDVISTTISLEKKGKNYIGLCPFHQEKTPSFNVSEEHQYYHCYGCQKSGDVFTFFMEKDALTFPEAMKKVAEFSHTELPEFHKENIDPETKLKRQLTEWNEKAAQLYHFMLLNTEFGRQPMEYLEERKLSLDSIKTFQIGFAPDKQDNLSLLLKDEKKEELLQSGLFFERNNGTLSDRFSSRITFPIRNDFGKVVGFSARKIYSEEEAKTNPELKKSKYVNTEATPIFLKNELLFNFDLAKPIARKQGEIYLFEGQMDVIAAYQAGIENGVATLGTSLSEIHLRKIEKKVSRIILVFDGDKAGIEATHKALKLIQEKTQLEVQIVTLESELDPDEFIRKFGEESFRKVLVDGRKTWFSFKKDYLKKGKNLTNPTNQLEFISQLIPELAKLSAIELDASLNDLVNEYPSFSYETLFSQVEEERSSRKDSTFPSTNDWVGPPSFPEETGGSFEEPQTVVQRNLSLIEKAEQQLMYRIFYQGVHHKFKDAFHAFHFPHEAYEKIYVLFQAYEKRKGDFEPSSFLPMVEQSDLLHLVEEILQLDLAEEVSETEIMDLLRNAKSFDIKNQILELKEELLRATQSGNIQLAKEISQQFILLQKKKNQEDY